MGTQSWALGLQEAAGLWYLPYLCYLGCHALAIYFFNMKYQYNTNTHEIPPEKPGGVPPPSLYIDPPLHISDCEKNTNSSFRGLSLKEKHYFIV